MTNALNQHWQKKNAAKQNLPSYTHGQDALRMNDVPNKLSRILSVVGFSILAVFFGVGVAWLAVGILVSIFNRHGDQLITGCMPILVAGGVLGFVAGLVVSLREARSDPKTEQKIVKRFMGKSGRETIYLGVPMLVIAACAPLLEPLSHHFGDRIAIYSYYGFALVVIAVSLLLYDRIPERFIISVGVIGWLLFVLMTFGFWYYV
jgi:hypothetical protein